MVALIRIWASSRLLLMKRWVFCLSSHCGWCLLKSPSHIISASSSLFSLACVHACRCFFRLHRLSECMQLQYKLYMITLLVCVLILTAITSGDPTSIADHESVAIFLMIRFIEHVLLFLLM